jgi:hypothetical protein
MIVSIMIFKNKKNLICMVLNMYEKSIFKFIEKIFKNLNNLLFIYRFVNEVIPWCIIWKINYIIVASNKTDKWRFERKNILNFIKLPNFLSCLETILKRHIHVHKNYFNLILIGSKKIYSTFAAHKSINLKIFNFID